MALVIPGTELRNKLLTRFPRAVAYLEAGSFIPKFVERARPDKSILAKAYKDHDDCATIGDILYQSTQMQIISSRLQKITQRPMADFWVYEAYKLNVTITMLTALEQALVEKECIPKILLSKIFGRPKGMLNELISVQEIVKDILEDMLNS